MNIHTQYLLVLYNRLTFFMTNDKEILPMLFVNFLLAANGIILLIFNVTNFNIISLQLFASFFVIFAYLYSIKMPRMIIWFILSFLSLFYLQPLFVSILMPQVYEPELYRKYVYLCTVSMHIFIIFYIVFSLLLPAQSTDHQIYLMKKSKFDMLILFYTALMLLSIILIFADVGSLGNLIGRSRVESKEQTTIASVAAYYLITFSAPLYAVCPIFVKRQRLLGSILIVLLIIMEIIILFAFRIRTFLLIHIAAVFIGVVVLQYKIKLTGFFDSVNIKRHERNIYKYFYILLLLIFVGIITRFLRGQYETGGFFFNAQAFIVKTLLSGDMGYTNTIMSLLDYVPRNHDYLNGQSYYRLFFIFIPRSIWSDKPLSTERIVADWLFPGAPELTIPPGIIGDIYINFSYWGILFMPVFSLFFAVFNKLRGLTAWIMFACSFGFIFHIVRGGFTNPIILLTVLFVSSTLIRKLTREVVFK